MPTLQEVVQESTNPKVYAIFVKKAGAKLEKASELALHIFNTEDKNFDRALADALERLNLV